MRTKLLLAISLLAVVALLGAFAVYRYGPRHVPEGQPPLAEISEASLPALRDAFNQASGKVRVVLLASPT